MNALRKYLTDRKVTQEEFGLRFTPAVSQGLIHQWMNFLDGKKKGATRITPERAVEIERLTDGAVPKHKLCKLFAPAKPAKAAA